MEPTHNYSDHGLGYTSFDDHIESNPMDDEPIEICLFETTFYEPNEASPHRTDVRREWTVLENKDYFIQTIPLMIPSTDENVLYKGIMFMSKDELKITLGRLTLTYKFKYRIKRSNKTHFEASCKDIGCKFQLHAIEMQKGSYWTIARNITSQSLPTLHIP